MKIFFCRVCAMTSVQSTNSTIKIKRAICIRPINSLGTSWRHYTDGVIHGVEPAKHYSESLRRLTESMNHITHKPALKLFWFTKGNQWVEFAHEHMGRRYAYFTKAS